MVKIRSLRSRIVHLFAPRIAAPAALVCLLTACNDAQPPAAAPVAAPKHEETKVVTALAPITQTVRLEALGLKLDAPRACNVRDLSEKQALKERLQCPGMLFEVTAPDKGDPKTFDQAKKAEHVHSHLVVTKEEKTADGWNIQFHNSDLGTDLYEVSIRRTLAGKPYQCGTNSASQPEEAERIATACQSLAAL